MNEHIKVSVIIPVYNAEKYLEECLDSVINQTLQEVEILCVDDVSTDSSKEILEQYARKCSNFRVFMSEKNRGQAYARNCGMKEAVGEFIYFLDSDDLLSDRNALETLYYKAIEMPVDSVFFDSNVIYETQRLKEMMNNTPKFTESFSEGIYRGSEYFCGMIENQFFSVAVWRQFWKREFLVGKNLFFQENTSPHEDLLFTFKAVFSAERIKYFPKALHTYRFREGSSTATTFNKKRFLAYFRCLFSSIRFIDRKEININERRALHRYFAYIRGFLNDNMAELIKQGENLNISDFNKQQEKLYYHMILLAEYPYINRLFTPEEYKLLTSGVTVIVYGTGKSGENVCRLLERFGITDYKRAVTKKPLNATGNVYEISDFAINRGNSVVIVATMRDDYQKEMKNTLNEMGFKTYISLANNERD